MNKNLLLFLLGIAGLMVHSNPSFAQLQRPTNNYFYQPTWAYNSQMGGDPKLNLPPRLYVNQKTSFAMAMSTCTATKWLAEQAAKFQGPLPFNRSLPQLSRPQQYGFVGRVGGGCSPSHHALNSFNPTYFTNFNPYVVNTPYFPNTNPYLNGGTPYSPPLNPLPANNVASSPDDTKIIPKTENLALGRSRDEKTTKAQEAYDRGVKAEQEGKYLLAKVCYDNACTMYPDTPVYSAARHAYLRMDNLLSKGK